MTAQPAISPLARTAAAPSRANVACSHCRLPVPPGLFKEGAEHQFCCHGCETAFSVINSCGLANYYALLQRAEHNGAALTPAKSTKRAYAEFDDPTFQALYCRPLPGGLMQTELLLEGVHCTACVWLVEKLPQIVPGVAESRLDLRRASVTVVFDPAQAKLSTAARTLDSLGYPPHPARGQGGMTARELRKREDRKMLVNMAVAGACAGNIMLLFIALYAGMFEGIEHAHEQLFRWASLGLTAICLAWPGQVFLRSAIAAIRTRTMHLDVPIALGLYLGGIWGMYKTIAGSGDIYFDSITALIFFLLCGRYVQQRQRRFAADSVELLYSLTPTVARKLDPSTNESTDVPVEALAINDFVEVRAGDSIPVDGVITSGSSTLDTSLLTGESRPISAAIGDSVIAGAVNLSGVLHVQVQATGEHTRIGRLMRTVEEASRRRAKIIQQCDRLAGIVLVALLALAALTLVIWWRPDPTVAIDRAAALLIAVCPCGLGLATPLAMTVAVGRAARRGILIKGADALQALADARRVRGGGTIVLDKTGTITLGKLSLVSWHGDESLKPFVAALESASSHPIALALSRDLATDDLDTLNLADVRQHQGAGIEGTVASGGTGVPPVIRVRTHLLVGTRALLAAQHIHIPADIDAAASIALAHNLTPVFIAADGMCIALASLGDPIRPDAASSIRALQARGYTINILSGDHEKLVKSVGASLGLDPSVCHGGVTPEGKLDYVQSLAKKTSVIMVGDGVNDSAALAAANVGIAVRGGAEASLSAADISLGREGLTPLVELIDGAGQTIRTIYWTIAASIFYNVIAAALAVAGLISPLLAAIIMPASSFTVVAICLRSGAFKTRATAPPLWARAVPATRDSQAGGPT